MTWAWTTVLSAILLTAGDSPRVGWITVESADVLVEPQDSAFSTGRLVRGKRVTVRRDGPDGWVAINPPEGSFSLIEESDLEDLGDGRARILSKFAAVRPGRDGAKMPGPPRVTLRQGTIVRLLDRRPLSVRDGVSVQTWVPVAPPKQEVRFLRSETVGDVEEPEDTPESTPRISRLASDREPVVKEPPARELGVIDPAFFATSPNSSESGISREVAETLASIASRHQAELRKPIDQWNLSPIEAEYVKLQKSGLEAADRRAVEQRLALVRHQKDAASSASRISSLLAKSRSRDGQMAEVRRGANRAGREIPGDYDVAGLLQTTSRMVEGQRVYALLGDAGQVLAYLSIPPGFEIKPFISHRIGVRGEGRFEETLRTRLYLVRDVELLNDLPPDIRVRSPLRDF